MSTTPAKKKYTVEQFERSGRSKGFELLDGVRARKPMGNKASSLTVNLTILLGPFVKQHKLGTMCDAEGGYVLFPDRPDHVRKPDLSFVRSGRLPNDVSPDGFARLVPDLAFESVSPGDRAGKLQAKVNEYLAAGVPHIWVAYPVSRTIHVYRPDGTVRHLTEADTLTADDLFPGWTCPVAELFAGV